ncbi:hypothetical protein [Alkalihalobacillus sp. BA299]|uniref:hypothetical protein n=1 Tax=Alkalihalobacillus sp. BA299 TaxID=2815938 RepID=UPI001ADC26FE|nr:hypothetical protein [Alkalihalobacillus sp. BA299]
MLFNILLGFIIPWVILLFALRNHLKLVILFTPIGAVIAFLFNEVGFQYFWGMKPIYKNVTLSALPINLGVFSVMACFICYFFTKRKVNPLVLILVFSLILTVIEWIVVVYEILFYFNGWNIGWTYLSYVLAFVLTYGYYVLLVKYNILRKG